MARRAIDRLPEAEREAAVRLEQAEIDAFENSPPRISTSGSNSRDPTWTEGSFKCQHPGCTALPFHTQYLLK